jgi:hypothetical protein
MWARIFNHPAIQGNEELRSCMLNQLNFEYAYAAVMETENYKEEEKKAFTGAIRSAFRDMHKNIFAPTNQKLEGIWNVFDLFVKPFGGSENEYGLFFTLNQDSCVEVAYSNSEEPNSDIDILGIVPKDVWFKNGILDTLDEEPIPLPDQADVAKMKTEFCEGNVGRFLYLKLHGSYGWRKRDGSEAMVIGSMTSAARADEPLFTWYQEVFKNTLLNKGQRLVVVGYGFRDPHINKAIADGISKAELRLHIVDRTDPEQFQANLRELQSDPDYPYKHIGDVIWEGLAGYHQGQITDFYDVYHLTHDGENFLRNLGLVTR